MEYKFIYGLNRKGMWVKECGTRKSTQNTNGHSMVTPDIENKII